MPVYKLAPSKYTIYMSYKINLSWSSAKPEQLFVSVSLFSVSNALKELNRRTEYLQTYFQYRKDMVFS